MKSDLDTDSVNVEREDDFDFEDDEYTEFMNDPYRDHGTMYCSMDLPLPNMGHIHLYVLDVYNDRIIKQYDSPIRDNIDEWISSLDLDNIGLDHHSICVIVNSDGNVSSQIPVTGI
jgi:hypothetical protein